MRRPSIAASWYCELNGANFVSLFTSDEGCTGGFLVRMGRNLAMKDLKERVVRGGFAKVCAQGANFALRIGSLMVLARLLDPKDFGLVGMVTAFTGVLNLFRDFGLSTATVQRDHVTDDQVSTLFWINIFVGVVLAFILIGLAPFVAIFYHD